MITINNARLRACGRRKQGGYYLVAPEFVLACCRGQIPLRRCNDCGEPLARPWRGIRYISPGIVRAAIIAREGAIECRFPGQSGTCPLGETRLRTSRRFAAVWVGAQHYPTPQAFLDEAAEQGMSRRIPYLPRAMRPGQTVLVVHPRVTQMTADEVLVENAMREEEDLPAIRKDAAWWPGIIATVPLRVQYVVPETDVHNEAARPALEALAARGVELVRDIYPDGQPAEPVSGKKKQN